MMSALRTATASVGICQWPDDKTRASKISMGTPRSIVDSTNYILAL